MSMRFILVCLLGLVVPNACFAAEDTAVIVKAEGNVAISDTTGKRERTVGTRSVLSPKSVLLTGENGRAVVRLGSAGYAVLEKNSKIEIGNTKDHAGFLRQITGMIYYALNSIKKDQQRFEVRTTTAIIGIRGTRFLVADMPDRNEIGMRKGLISVASPEGEYEIHRKAEQDEFEAYKQEANVAIAKENQEFEEYKAESQREFVEFKREFSLEANRMATFDGKRVVDRPLSAESIKDMETLETYSEKWLKEVRD